MVVSNQAAAQQFSVDLERLVQRVEDRTTEIYRRIALELFRQIIFGGNGSPGVPVDTGFARASFVISLNGSPSFRQPSRRPSGERGGVDGSGFDETQGRVAEATLSDSITLSSNCEYVPLLEFGTTKLVGVGFVVLALLGVERIAQRVVSEMNAGA